MNGFAAQMVTRAFTVFARASEVGSLVYPHVPLLWFDHELEKSKGLGSHADGYVTVEQHNFIEESIGHFPDCPGADYAALYLSPAEGEEIAFLTYRILSHLYTLNDLIVSIGQRWLDGERWGCTVLKKGPSIGVWISAGLCCRVVPGQKVSSLPAVAVKLYETGNLVSHGPLLLQSE